MCQDNSDGLGRGDRRDVSPFAASEDEAEAPPTLGNDVRTRRPDDDVIVPLRRARPRTEGPRNEDPDDDDPGPAAA